MYIAWRLVEQIIQIECNIAKNPNWSEANQLAIYKHNWGLELEKQIQVVVREESEPSTS